jgi:pimeloyl-ACP methyl ester carboxylesterase
MSANLMPPVVFSHGKDSEPWGHKILALAEVARAQGYAVESVDYRGIDSVSDRLERLIATCRAFPHAPILVGSSLGGFLSVAASVPVEARALFLMAPAFDLPGLPATPPVASCPTVVVHGWRDDVVPVGKALAFAQAQQATTYLVADDHRLHASLPRIARWFDDLLLTLRG